MNVWYQVNLHYELSIVPTSCLGSPRMVKRVKRKRGWKSLAFLAWGDFHARLRFALSLWGKMRTTRSLTATSPCSHIEVTSKSWSLIMALSGVIRPITALNCMYKRSLIFITEERMLILLFSLIEMIINANTYALGSESNSYVTRIFFVPRACLHEGGGPR